MSRCQDAGRCEHGLGDHLQAAHARAVGSTGASYRLREFRIAFDCCIF